MQSLSTGKWELSTEGKVPHTYLKEMQSLKMTQKRLFYLHLASKMINLSMYVKGEVKYTLLKLQYFFQVTNATSFPVKTNWFSQFWFTF